MATSSSLPPAELSVEELRFLRHLSRTLDDLLEESLKRRESLGQTFQRIFTPILGLTRAQAIVVTTLNEQLVEESFSFGFSPSWAPAQLLVDHPWGVTRVAGGTFVSQALDVSGQRVGAMGLFFDGDESADSPRLLRTLETLAEELDTVLSSVQTAAEKHHLIIRFNELLSNPVFEQGMDQAVLGLTQRVQIPGLLLLYRDAVRWNELRYRVYERGHLAYASGGRPLERLEAAIAERGAELIRPEAPAALRAALGQPKVVETALISGGSVRGQALGKVALWSEGEGFSAFTLDLLRVLSATLAQRLVDYNRERIHLSQFFSSPVIDELMKDPSYVTRYLSPRDEEVGILFADINGFTRICEQVLERPERIGQFVDDWSREAVEILWRHGGVFDKMVGDCIIGLFGPPLFKSSRQARTEAAVRAALEIQDFTRDRMGKHPEVARLSELVQLPGLGVAIGVNLANTFCGLFGPNRQYTGFSTGMNQTARLQSLGGFRETLVMESAHRALSGSRDPAIQQLRFGPVTETAVKNVAQPLRYFKLER